MPPKNLKRKATATDGTLSPHVATLAEQLSYLHLPRPFKNPEYTKNLNRRAKNLKNIMGQERERERAEREKRRLEKAEKDAMEVDGKEVTMESEEIPTYLSIEAPPSVLPHKHYCDITGLEAPYTDPVTGLRYHDKDVYALIKEMSASTAKEYLSARGVNSIVK
ncbi:YL1 nuclear protein C-terminal domain-containing protein [Lentinula edodes]|uniref:Ino eighty subunit 6 n=2 Tax=Lentinula TaxID=5352 RepID=A0A1Q3E353_LENED|nr:YL1 nuclear protein C-terminal domain-containing protein [Lentinula edodes]KAJ3901834.1 YL1 nuclear protein C-terminal domain-containing protein [Lentinula edodes]KAJ3921025.1 YL1 nuclear protein C-terminal domain-containing protein [Lentinula edodes]KAJ4484286.1 YL1 nuclear protein C-terminal domain-containing protein [Lentinula edodes]GAW01591.1 ino eighty subunit 6 [Lentinula edodes]